VTSRLDEGDALADLLQVDVFVRMTSPGSSAVVEIWSVSTIANSPYAVSPVSWSVIR